MEIIIRFDGEVGYEELQLEVDGLDDFGGGFDPRDADQVKKLEDSVQAFFDEELYL